MRSRFLQLAVIVLLFSGAWQALAGETTRPAGGLENYLPETTSFVLSTADTSNLYDRIRKCSLFRLASDPEVAAYLGVGDDLDIEDFQKEFKDEAGIEFSEFLSFFEGQVILAVLEFDTMIKEDLEHDLPIVILADISGHEDDVEAVIERLEENEEDEETDSANTLRVDEVEGVPVHFWFEKDDEGELLPDGGWAIAGGMLLVSGQQTVLEDFIRQALGEPRPDNLGNDPGYRKLVRSLKEGTDVSFFLDLRPLVKLFNEAMQEEAENDASAAPGQDAPEKPPFDVEKLIPVLNLDVLENVGAGLHLSSTAIEITGALHYSADLGLLRFLAYGPDPAPRPDFIPADVVAFGTAFFDISRAWETLELGVGTLFPGVLEMAGGRLAMMTSQAEIELDLRKELLENLSGKIISMTFENEEDPGETIPLLGAMNSNIVVLIGIHDTQTMQTLLDKGEILIKSITAAQGQAGEGNLFSRETVDDMTIYSINQSEGEQSQKAGPVFAVMPEYFAVSLQGKAPLRHVHSMMHSEGRTVWQKPEVQEAFGKIPAEANAIQFADAAMVMRIWLAAFKNGYETAKVKAGGEPAEEAAIPSEAVIRKYIKGISAYSVKGPHSWSGRFSIIDAGGGGEE